MAKSPKGKSSVKQSKKKPGTRPKAMSSSAGCLCNPGEYPAGSLFYSNGDDEFLPVEGGDDGDYLRMVGRVPTWVP